MMLARSKMLTARDSSTSSLGGIMRSSYSIHCADESKVQDLQGRVKSLVSDMGYKTESPNAKQTSEKQTSDNDSE